MRHGSKTPCSTAGPRRASRDRARRARRGDDRGRDRGGYRAHDLREGRLRHLLRRAGRGRCRDRHRRSRLMLSAPATCSARSPSSSRDSEPRRSWPEAGWCSSRSSSSTSRGSANGCRSSNAPSAGSVPSVSARDAVVASALPGQAETFTEVTYFAAFPAESVRITVSCHVPGRIQCGTHRSVGGGGPSFLWDDRRRGARRGDPPGPVRGAGRRRLVPAAEWKQGRARDLVKLLALAPGSPADRGTACSTSSGRSSAPRRRWRTCTRQRITDAARSATRAGRAAGRARAACARRRRSRRTSSGSRRRWIRRCTRRAPSRGPLCALGRGAEAIASRSLPRIAPRGRAVGRAGRGRSGRRDGAGRRDAGTARSGRPARRTARLRGAERRRSRRSVSSRGWGRSRLDARIAGGPAFDRALAAVELELRDAPVAERAELLATRADLLMATGRPRRACGLRGGCRGRRAGGDGAPDPPGLGATRRRRPDLGAGDARPARARIRR